MAEATDVKTEAKIDAAKAAAAAEKAYAAAAEKVEVKAEPAMTEIKQAAPVAKTAAPAAKVAAPAKVASPKAAKAKPAAKKVAAKKVAAKKIAKPATAKAAKPVVKATPLTQFKDTIMNTTAKLNTEDFTAKVKDAMTDAQDRAKVAYEKGQALFGEAGEFTKGNVEALVESGKILAAGLQDMGKDYVADAKTAFETVQGDVKAVAAVKSPADFFKLQGEILRRNFDAAVALGSKRSEAALKLANDAFAPISTRVSVAIDKVKKAA